MKVYCPGNPEKLEGGIKTSIKHQRKALKDLDVEMVDSLEDADLLHLNILSPKDFWRLRKAKKRGLPVVVHTHEIGENFAESFTFSTRLQPLARKWVDLFYSRADLLICPSEYARKTLERRIDGPKKVVSNGVDPERFEEYEPKRGGGFTVVNVSILFERKGLSDFVSVAEKLPDTDFKWFGPEFNRILASGVKKQKKRAPENCVFPGFEEKVADAYGSGDVFFFPTKSETQGLSVIEAAYLGMPIVVRDIPVYTEDFTHEENCLKADTVEGFVEQISRLKQDEELRNRISENARQVGEKHTLEKIGDKLVEAYGQVIGE
ncbi:MAG: glycosyltransferase family 4 protein [Candidatus Nanohaloarchaea archaeon]